MPIVSVTPLGSSSDGVGSAIGQIIDYLERGIRRPQPNASLVGYYADTPTTAGVWRGRGVDGYQLTGPVHTETFRTVLEGNHPLTTETLVSAVGSSGRADPTRSKVAVSPTGEPGEILSTEQVAALLGVSERYVRKVAAEPGDPAETTKARLDGVRADGRNWVFRRDDIEDFAAGRSEKKVVVAYDVTVSFEKSISLASDQGILWSGIRDSNPRPSPWQREDDCPDSPRHAVTCYCAHILSTKHTPVQAVRRVV